MPKTTTVTPMERRDWLDRVENGERVDVIARGSGRDTRTVNTNIDRARRERDFAAAQRDRLRDALNAHQQDMLELLQRIGPAAVVPTLDWESSAPDFGMEKLLSDQEMSGYSEVGVGPGRSSSIRERGSPFPVPYVPAVTVVRDREGPREVRFPEEGSKPWGLLLEHINRREPIWTRVSAYKDALLDECNARAALNREISAKAESATNLKTLWTNQSRFPCLTPAFASFARSLVTRKCLGLLLLSAEEEIRPSGNGGLDNRAGRILAQDLQNLNEVRERLLTVIDDMSSAPETSRAANAYRNLQLKADELKDTVEDFLLLRYLAGSCRICKLLGAP